MTNSTHFFNKMKFFFSIIISFALIVILRLFSPLLPIPFIKVSSCPITMKVTRYIIQLTAGHFFFMYGYAAWLLPILIITFPLLENNSRLSTRMARILGFFSILFSSSALCAYHNMYYSYFLCGGIIGNIIVKTIASYAPIIHTNTGMIVFFLTSLICFLQKDIITACSFINKTIKFTVIVESFFKYIYAWIAYAFPIIENIYKIKEYEKYSISLLLQSIAESDILENQSLESITPAITLSQIAKIEKKKNSKQIHQVNYDFYAEKIIAKLKALGIDSKYISFQLGPRLVTFFLEIAPHVRISSLLNFENDIAYALGKQLIRIYAPAPGSNHIGIETEAEHQSIISLTEILSQEKKDKKNGLLVTLGLNSTGSIASFDLTEAPHLLIAGTTGSGKSVTIHSIIISLLWNKSSSHLKLILIDPKRLECGLYQTIPHLLCPVLHKPEDISKTLENLLQEMRTRYQVLADHAVRNISELYSIHSEYQEQYPYYVVIIDEYADIKMTLGKEYEKQLAALCQMSRAAGIHVIVATQRPSVDIISGILKANIPTRIACKVATSTDSKVIIDTCGAEKLLGKGDMLFLDTKGNLTRIHGAYISTHEIEYLVSGLIPDLNNTIVKEIPL